MASRRSGGGTDNSKQYPHTASVTGFNSAPLSREDFRRCATLGILQPAEEHQASKTTSVSNKGHLAWGLMWTGKCRWTLKRDRPLSETVLRAALLELIRRHPALNSEPAEPLHGQPIGLFNRTQVRAELSRGAQTLDHAMCWAFRQA